MNPQQAFEAARNAERGTLEDLRQRLGEVEVEASLDPVGEPHRTKDRAKP
jgi:hypothetical protein